MDMSMDHIRIAARDTAISGSEVDIATKIVQTNELQSHVISAISSAKCGKKRAAQIIIPAKPT